MNKIVALQREHDLTLPDEFHFKYAQVALLAQTCAGQSRGAECWKELANQPECYVWNPYFHPDETVTWTGKCAGVLAQGTGTLILAWDSGKGTTEGCLRGGKKHDRWVFRKADGSVSVTT